MPKIKIYSTHTCPYCKMEKEFLDSKGFKYDNVFVDDDIDAAQEVMNLSGQVGVPFNIVTKDDGSTENVLGYDKEKLSALLGLS